MRDRQSVTPDTRDDALRALAELTEPFNEFSFESAADRSVFLAALLTPLVRWHLRTAPLFVITAPRRGSGKTLLARCIALLATGRSPWTMSPVDSEEESRKRWLALLLAGAQIVNLDNLEAALGGATLCALLTEDRLTDRVLGTSRVETVSTTQLVIIATGNNVEFEGDITRRVLVCRIDPGVEFPEDRTFRLDLDDYLLKHRRRLVVAALTILRAYHVAGRPSANVRPFGSFEAWSDLVRGALLWLGEADPCGRRLEAVEDPRAGIALELLTAWSDALGENEVTVRDVLSLACSDPLGPLAAALQPICGTATGDLDTSVLGRWLRQARNRVQAGLRIESVGSTGGRARWRVRRV